MIDIRSFDCEITDPVDVFVGPSRGRPSRNGDDLCLFVVLPSFSFKVLLKSGNCSVLRSTLDQWSPPPDK